MVCYHLCSLAVFSRWKITGIGLNENWGKKVVTGINEYKNQNKK